MVHSTIKKSISELLESPESIKLYADAIAKYLEEEEPTDDALVLLSHTIKSRVQLEACTALIKAKDWGCIFMATGSGKSKIAVDRCKSLINKDGTANILIVVPTEKLRDENWKEEFRKWQCLDIWEHHVKRCCYASLNKYYDEDFDLVVLDEGHNITENNSEFFKQNVVRRCIVLTATRPRDQIKINILKSLNLNPVYELSLDESVKLGLVAPYDITIVNMNLDDKNKYIPAGSKAKPFKNTEKAQYGYLSARLNAMPHKMGFINRMRFIYTLKSKTEAAKWIIDNVIPKDLRTLIFCGSKEQANQLSDYRFYSRPSPPKKLDPSKRYTPFQLAKYEKQMEEYRYNISIYQGDDSFNKFKRGEINQMACVNSVNEGHNLEGMDIGFVVQLNSNELNLIQRIGRLIRFRPGHRGTIIILCVQDSVDKDWTKKATENLNVANINHIELSHLKMGIEKISFD